jgi:NADH-quinone oxidoreductase subunit N
MTTPINFSSLLLTILPEISLAVLALLLLFLELVWKKRKRASFGWVTVAGLILAALASAAFFVPQNNPVLIWGGMLRLDHAGAVFRVLVLIGAAITALFSIEEENLYCCGEFYFLLVISTLGLTMLAAASDLIMVFLALETASVPLYILTGFRFRNEKSVESGLKYLLYGAMASTVMLFGFTFLYGFSGTTQLYEIGAAIQSGNIPVMAAAFAGLLVLAGLGFKISAVPFHFWAPDVYEGAPTAVAGFLSTASKAGGFAVLLRFSFAVFPSLSIYTPQLIAILAVASMLVGNLLALSQKNFKRFLAYSSIAQAGYILVGVAASSDFGATGVLYYLMAYLTTNLAAFGIAFLSSRTTESDDIAGLAGLSRRAPFLGFALLISLLSLGGIPPFAGFIGKLIVFSAAVKAGMAWLAVVAVLNSVVSLYYYLKVLKVAFLEKPVHHVPVFQVSFPWRMAFLVCIAGILVLGVVLAPWYGWASDAASSLILY